jgi:hypothetical protein
MRIALVVWGDHIDFLWRSVARVVNVGTVVVRRVIPMLIKGP